MTTYNTGNPIGSKDPRDLYDNAENLDEAVNTRTAESWDDRFGVARKTWWGMEQDFQQFLVNSSFQPIGDYAQGLQITALNQVFWYDDNLYRLGPGADLPYTITGNWEEESSLFRMIGDTFTPNIVDVFPSSPYENQLVVLMPEREMYAYVNGAWSSVASETRETLNDHANMGSSVGNVHGLRDQSLALVSGSYVVNGGLGSIALGSGASVENSSSSVAIGRDVSVSGSPSTLSAFNLAFGLTNQIHLSGSEIPYDHRKNLVVGFDSENRDSSGSQSFGSGNRNIFANNAYSFGSQNYLSGGVGYKFAFGQNNNVVGANSYAYGRDNDISHDNCFAFGRGLESTGSGQLLFGSPGREVTLVGSSVHVPGNFTVTGTKNFKIDHPITPDTHDLIYGSYEGPVPGGNIYRLSVETVDGIGFADLPKYFDLLNTDPHIWCQADRHFGQAYAEIIDNRVKVTSNEDGKYFILVVATRCDEGTSGWEGTEVLKKGVTT